MLTGLWKMASGLADLVRGPGMTALGAVGSNRTTDVSLFLAVLPRNYQRAGSRIPQKSPVFSVPVSEITAKTFALFVERTAKPQY